MISDRWLFIGDSIFASVYETPPCVPDAKRLVANQISQMVDISIINLSAPGNRMVSAGSPDFGLDANLNLLNYMRGTYLYKGIICQLGHNDATTPGVTPDAFIAAYRKLPVYCKANGIAFVCLPILPCAQDAAPINHGGSLLTVQQFRQWQVNVTAEQATGSAANTIKSIYTGSFGLEENDFFDGTHMRGSGHEKVAAGIVSQMQAFGFWPPSNAVV